MDSKLIKTLKKLDLTSYEAKAYITLNHLISGTAVEIAKESNIPRSKIYDILKSLNRKKFIEIKEGKPLKFTVIPPTKSFKAHKENLIDDLEEAEETLREIYKKEISHVQAPMWLIPTEEKIKSKEVEIIKEAKKKLNIRIGFLSEGEAELLIKTFRKLAPTIEIKILASRECEIHNEKIDIIKTFQDANIKNLQIEEDDIPFAKLIIRDEEEMFRIYAKHDPETLEAIPNTNMGVWNKYKEICKNYDDRFESEFMKIKRKELLEGINI
ncbi:MAG: transcriptional regulator [archaeon]|nr:transcriptional regulator [archaeon]